MTALAKVLTTLTPWNGEPYRQDNPHSAMRQVVFGSGKGWVTYLVLDDIQRVDILRVIWMD